MNPLQLSSVAQLPQQQPLTAVKNQDSPPVKDINDLGNSIISKDPKVSALKLKAPTKVEITNEHLDIIKNTCLVEIKNGNYTKGPSLAEISPDELDKIMAEKKPLIKENLDGTLLLFNMKPPKEGLIFNNKWYPPSALKQATDKDYLLLNQSLMYLKDLLSGKPEEKDEKEEKEVVEKSSFEIINQNRSQAHLGSKDANGNGVVDLEKQMMIVSLMKAFSTQSSKNERTHQEKESEKTKECMALHMKDIARQILHQDLEKHSINAKIIDQKSLKSD